jgi:hypothetical protein
VAVEPDALHLVNRGVAHDKHCTHSAYSTDTIVGDNLCILEGWNYGGRDKGKVYFTLDEMLYVLRWGCKK